MTFQRVPTMVAVLLWLSVITAWTTRSMAQPCPFVQAEAEGNEAPSSVPLDLCLQCLGTSCDFVYYSMLLPGLPCRQILNGTSPLLTQYAYRQCAPVLPVCNSVGCGGSCSPCTESRTVSLTENCSVTGGFRTCMQQRCTADLVRILVTSPASAAMTGNCQAFCTAQLGCEAYVETNTSCVTLQNLTATGFRELVFANSTGCVMENVTDFCFTSPCQNGGVCVNGTSSFACLCPQNFTGPDCSVPVPSSCPGVITSPGVSAMISSYAVGSSVTYMCLDNFLPTSGDVMQTCLSNGTWSGSPLMCGPVVTYLASLRVIGRVYSIISIRLFGTQGNSPVTNIRIVAWGFFGRGVTVPIRSPDLGTLQRAVVEVITGFNFPRPFLTLQLRVSAPNGDVYGFPTATLAGGDVRDLVATRI